MTDAKALAGMLAAEMDTTIRHAERRHYEEHYRQFLERFEAGNFCERPSSPLKKALLTGFHSTAKHNATKAVSPSSETMRTI